ncbi:MAG: GNAT family N-acetyltransferase [Bryobacter sp.]|nr:GNAT family N-acetyltransferase [Bryobacter sp.]
MTVREILNQDRAWSAYALADLDPSMAHLCEWFVEERSLVLVVRQIDPPPLFTIGDPETLGRLLDRVPALPRVWLHQREEHLPALAPYYDLSARRAMWRMVLTHPALGPGTARRLTRDDASALASLYAQGGGEAFHESQIDQSYFFGIEEDDALIAAAGTHVVSLMESAAAIGSVMVHPAHRNRGLGGRITSAVAHALMEAGVRTIALNVAQDNAAAIRVYQRLGFATSCAFFEGKAARLSTG